MPGSTPSSLLVTPRFVLLPTDLTHFLSQALQLSYALRKDALPNGSHTLMQG